MGWSPESPIENMRTNTKLKHSKKRNVGLLYEFLVRHVSECLVEGRDRDARAAMKLIRRHILRKDTELHREFRLFHALANTTVESEHLASLILAEARQAAKRYDADKLDHEKSLLIRGINHTFNDSGFYDKRLDEYRIYATIQVLLNEWRLDMPTDIGQLALYEQDVIRWLTTPKSKNVLEESKPEVDDLLVNLMVKRVSKKYDGLLNQEQAELLKQYVYMEKSGDGAPLRKLVEDLRSSTLVLIDQYLNEKKDEPYLAQHLQEVKALIGRDVTQLDDATLSQFLRIAKLKAEILSKGE